MKKLYILLFVVLLVSSQYSVYGQQKPVIPINTAVERVQKFFGVYPVEKVHIHFDKPYYAVGDTLWLKTYLNHNAIAYDPSKIIYVEMINSKDSLIQTLRIPLTKNAGKGQLVLDPQFIAQDNYRFRAYTKWMTNFDQQYFFNKVVTIGDAINKKLAADITFIPDGEHKTKVSLQFRKGNGDLLSRRKISWEAIDGWDAFDKGKSETDDMGNSQINLTIKDKSILNKARLIVKVDGEKLEPSLVGNYALQQAFWHVDMQFFPEGGELLAGTTKKVAFKVVGAQGKGLRVNGKIIDSKKKEVATFSDLGLGMGTFSFLPILGEKYKAVVQFADESSKTFDLPAVAAEGVNLILHKQDAASIQLAIVANDAYFTKHGNRAFYVLGQSNGHLIYAAQASLKSNTILVSIPKDKLPNGIVQMTLMEADGTLLSERLLYNESQGLLAIDVKSNKANYSRKEAVSLAIAVKNPVDSLAGTYSVTVIDEEKVPFDDDNDLGIISNILLAADLKGYIEKPNYYFNTKHENRLEALDALLMTQGFRRFEYASLLEEKLPAVTFMPEQGITISGTLRLNTGRLVPNGGLLLSVPSRNIRKDSYTDNNGRFAFENLVFPDSSKVTVNARGNDNYRSLVINMDQTIFPGIDVSNPYLNNSVLNIDQQLKAYLTNSKNEYRTSILIDEVEVTGVVRKQVTSREFSALSGLSMPDHRLEADRFSGCTVLTMCLNTMLTGITYDNQTLKYYVTRNYNQGGRTPVQFFLNGMPVDESSLNGVQVSEIEAIEIFMRDDLGTVSRLYQNDGVVSIMTKKEKKQPRMSLAEIEALLPKSNIIDMVPLGYVKERQFYNPVYATPESKNTNDYRTTIYWNPDVVVDATGQAQVNFYNADGSGKYKVIVEGQDEQGNIGRSIFYYEVN